MLWYYSNTSLGILNLPVRDPEFQFENFAKNSNNIHHIWEKEKHPKVSEQTAHLSFTSIKIVVNRENGTEN